MAKEDYKIGEVKFKKAGGHGPGRGFGPGPGAGEKAADFKGSIKKLAQSCKKYIPALIIAVIFAIISTSLTIIGPSFLSSMTDTISSGVRSQATGGSGIDLERLQFLGIVLIVLYASSWALGAAQSWIIATVTNLVTQKMRSDITQKINKITFSYLNKTTTGNILSHVTNDVDTIGQSFNQSIGNLVSAIVLFCGSLIMMITTDLWMTLTAVVASLIGFFFMFAIMKKSQKYYSDQQNALGAVNGYIEEIYAGHTVVKAYNAEEKTLSHFDELNKTLVAAGTKAATLSGMMMPFMNFVGNLGYVCICIVGGALALSGNISFGVIVAFMMYVRYFTQPLSTIAQSTQALQGAAAAGERIFKFLEAEEFDEKMTNKETYDGEDRVVFDHVCFGYEENKPIIKDFSMSAKAGQKIAIVGPTGAGKTTLISLLMRFYDINSGDIRISGKSIYDMERSEVHDHFCMVLQDAWLFEGTVKENLVYCTDNIEQEKIEEACRAVGIDHFIRTLSHGYDTVINDTVNLSSGQRQQITIARAMLSNRPMLILDEATSNVDTRTEAQIQAAMDNLMKDRTSFVIAHRLSTIKNADKILVINEGDIVESGTHEELIEQQGFYANLYNSQFDD